MPRALAKDGIKLAYQVSGDGSPVVFVHEFGGEPASWDFQVAYFRGDYRCITYAARGFYPSDIPEASSSYGQDRATSDLAAVLDHLGLSRAHLVGTSMGSFTSLDFTLRYPERVQSLTLVGNSSGPRDADDRERYRGEWIESEMDLRETAGGRGAVEVLERDPAYRSFRRNLPAAWNDYASRLEAQSVDGALNILKTLHWNRGSLWAAEAQLRAVTCPVFLAHGEEDYYLVTATNRYLETVLSNVKRQAFAATGHLVNIERAAEFNELLEQHLRAAEAIDS